MEESNKLKDGYKQSVMQFTLPKKDGEGEEIKEKLERLAAENYRTLSGQLILIVREFLERVEGDEHGKNE